MAGIDGRLRQCHSHKYDPISQADFYRLYAFFNNLDDHLIDAPLTADADQVAKARGDLQAAREQFLAVADAAQAEWESVVATRSKDWKSARNLELSSFRSLRHAMLRPLEDDSLFVNGRSSRYDAYEIEFRSPVKKLTAVRIESLNDPDRSEHGPGRGADQKAVVSGITIITGPGDKSLPRTKAEIADVQTDYCQDGFSAADAIKCEETGGWALDQIGVPHAALFVLRASGGNSRRRLDRRPAGTVHRPWTQPGSLSSVSHGRRSTATEMSGGAG